VKRPAVFLLAAALVAPPGAEAQPSLRGRPLVLLLHGRNQQNRTSAQLEAEWFGAFRQGLATVGMAQLLTPADYRMVFYQDLYRDTPLTGDQLCPGDEPLVAELNQLQQQGDALATQVQATSTVVASAEGDVRNAQRIMTLGSADAIRQEDLAFLEQRRAFLADANVRLNELRAQSLANSEQIVAKATELRQNRTERQERQSRVSDLWSRVRQAIAGFFGNDLPRLDAAMAWLFPDTDLYITQERYQCATDRRVAGALLSAKRDGRPVILVAHSMGTLVAFNLLVQDDQVARRKGRAPDYDVAAFVSVGSQLGIQPLVEDLIGRSVTPFPSPHSVKTWRNLRGDVDWVAPLAILGTYDVRHMSPAYTDYQIRTASRNPHDISEYLRHPATARTIVAAWCRAASPPAAVPPGCNAIADLDQATLPPGTRRVWPQ